MGTKTTKDRNSSGRFKKKVKIFYQKYILILKPKGLYPLEVKAIVVIAFAMELIMN